MNWVRAEDLDAAVVHLDGQVRFEDALGVLEAFEDVGANVDVRGGVVELFLEALERVRVRHHMERPPERE